MTAIETSSPCHLDGESLNNKQSFSVIKTMGGKDVFQERLEAAAVCAL